MSPTTTHTHTPKHDVTNNRVIMELTDLCLAHTQGYTNTSYRNCLETNSNIVTSFVAQTDYTLLSTLV